MVDGAGYIIQGTGSGTGIVLYERSNVTIQNMEIKAFYYGVRLIHSSDNVISENTITQNNGLGIFFYHSSDNVISENTITQNNEFGIYLYAGSNNTISRNTINANNQSGIELHQSSSNVISRNTITQNIQEGIMLERESSSNVISRNTITQNIQEGIILNSSSDHNNILGNSITNNECGVRLQDVSSNNIYNNDLVDNAQQADIQTVSHTNFWDYGYPYGGNFWSDYDGVDIRKGAGQDQPGSDGIGDTPYIIDNNNQDGYPLMNPCGSYPPPTYTLIISADVNGTTDPAPGFYTYSEGQNVSVEAIPYSGYIIDHWELDGADVGATNPISIIMEDSHILSIFFTPTYTATITVTTGGTTNPPPGSYTHTVGTKVNVTAIPDVGYYFDGWELDGVNNSANPIEVTMNTNHTVKAMFAPTKKYTLTVTTSFGGATDPAPGTYMCLSETLVSIAAMPDIGCYLDHWELDSINIGILNPVKVRMDMNHTLHAVFEQVSSGHDIAVKWISSKSVLGQGYLLSIHVAAINVGSYTETFNVTVYANATVINTKANVTLTSAQSITITFTWNTTAIPKGNYTLSVYAHPVPAETNLLDNNLTGGWVVVAMPGDLAGGGLDVSDFIPDGKVDGEDLIIVARCFGSWPEATILPWHLNCDITNDGIIDGSDLIVVAAHYGEQDP